MTAHDNATHFQALFTVCLKIKHPISITVTFEANKEWTLASKTYIFRCFQKTANMCILSLWMLKHLKSNKCKIRYTRGET